jgi:hypothetical protein
MSTITILDNEYATLWYHEEDGIVHHQFKKYIYGDDFRNVLNRGLELMKERGATKWLSDDRYNSALLPEDSDWAENDWSSRVHALGTWKYWAIVLPEGVIGRMNMDMYIEHQLAEGVVVRVFLDPSSALAWLKTV